MNKVVTWNGRTLTIPDYLLDKYKKITGTDALEHLDELCGICQKDLPDTVSDEYFTHVFCGMLQDEISMLEG